MSLATCLRVSGDNSRPRHKKALLHISAALANCFRAAFAASHKPATQKRSRAEETTMLDEGLARLRSHRNNILRYRKLLKTKLLEHERLFILRRLSEEQSAIEELARAAFPITRQAPEPDRRLAS
jgi:hypothetical protein